MDEEIKEEILDSPLIVHKVTDASYQETASEVGIQNTHADDDNDDEPTLERHRFKKENKKSKAPYFFVVFAVIVAITIGVLFSKGVIGPKQPEETTTTKKSYTTQVENKFDKTITVKGNYIFYEGEEVDGFEGLERKVKYFDAGTKLYIQDEYADSDFLNTEILSMLSRYGIDYEITHIVSSGLKSQYETTTTTTEKKKKKPKKEKTSQAVEQLDGDME